MFEARSAILRLFFTTTTINKSSNLNQKLEWRSGKQKGGLKPIFTSLHATGECFPVTRLADEKCDPSMTTSGGYGPYRTFSTSGA